MLPSPSLNLIPVHISHPSVKLACTRPPASGGLFFHSIVRLGRLKDNRELPIVAIRSSKRRAVNRLNLQKTPPPWTKTPMGQMLQLHVTPPKASAMIRVGFPLFQFAHLVFRLYLPGELFHLALAFASNAEKRAAARYARLLIAAHLDAKLLLNAFPFFLEVVHATMIAALAKRPSEKPQCRSPSLSHATLLIFACREQPRC